MNLDIGAVLFDCDGVLVNSEELIQEVSLKLLSDIGLDYTKQEFNDNFLGFTKFDYQAGLTKDYKDKHDKQFTNEMFIEIESKAISYMKQHVSAIDGVVDTIKNMQYKKAVASSSITERLHYKLKKVGLFDDFSPDIYAGDMVKKGKPEPDIFLLAASSINIEAKKCVVIEDSKNGIISANKAGMQAIGFTGGKHCSKKHGQDLLNTGAVAVIDDMNDLEKVLMSIQI